MKRKQQIAAIAVIAIICVAGVVYATADHDDGDYLIVETSPDFAPFDYLVGDEYAGIDMDIIRAVCKDMGYEVKFRTNTFDSILLSVPQGKCDIGASGFTISGDRGETVNFSTPMPPSTRSSWRRSTAPYRHWTMSRARG